MSPEQLLQILITLAILIPSVILHEVAHGFVADRLGDPTARLLKRLTLNPIPHIDPMMSILLPLILAYSGLPIFGAAKPVPVDPFNFREPRKDMAIVSLAGPGTNFLIAAVAALISHLLFPGASILQVLTENILGLILGLTITINISLAIFNLLPIPPLDGSKIFALFLPEDMSRSYLALGNVGFFIIFALMLFPIGGFSLGTIVNQLVDSALRLLGF
jgi:Zn-dependent protease